MKRTIAFLLIGAYLLMLGACQSAPDTHVGKTSRGNTQLAAQIVNAEEAPLPADFPQTEEQVQLRFSHASLPIHVDVDAFMQPLSNTSVSSYAVQPRQFTEEDARCIAGNLAGVDAPPLEKRNAGGSEHWWYSDGACEVTIGSGVTYRRSDAPIIKDGSPRAARSMTILPELQIGSLSYGDAKQQADAIVQEMTQDSYACRESYAVESDERQWYAFEYTRSIDNIPCALLYHTIANDRGEYETWEYERLWLLIDQNGLLHLQWRGAMEITDMLSEHTALMSFDTMLECFQKMLLVKNSIWEYEAQCVRYLDADGSEIVGPRGNGVGETEIADAVGAVNVEIDSIALVYMRVQSGSVYYLIPAWNFTGFVDVIGEDGQPFYMDKKRVPGCLLMLNAIDGSVIDVAQGY